MNVPMDERRMCGVSWVALRETNGFFLGENVAIGKTYETKTDENHGARGLVIL